MRVAIYTRVSTPEQQTLPLQLAALRKYARARKWKIVFEIEDVGSGAKDRIKRENLLEAARRREIDAVLVWKLDRWGRSIHDLFATLNELSELGAAFVSFTEAVDMSTSIGRALAGLLSVFAAFERDMLKVFADWANQIGHTKGILRHVLHMPDLGDLGKPQGSN